MSQEAHDQKLPYSPIQNALWDCFDAKVRLYHCACADSSTKSFSLLTEWLPEHTGPELVYIEINWAALMAYGVTVDLLRDVLPVNRSLNAATVRNHLHNAAKRLKAGLDGKPDHLSGCPRD